MNIGGVRWYYYLLPKSDSLKNTKSLFAIHPRQSLLNKFIVCWDYIDRNTKKETKLYAVFENYLNFAKFFLQVIPELRSFFEIILGERLQKPHFDIDMELNAQQLQENLSEKVLESLIETLKKIIPEISFEQDVCIYSSHSTSSQTSETSNKRSYHVVINHFCHANNKEAKAFYYSVMKMLPKEYFDNGWIDHAVYSKTQQFRIYQSKKLHTDRVKIFHEAWQYKNQTIKHVYDEVADGLDMQFLINFDESLVSARPGTCKLLPSFGIPEEFAKNKTFETGENVEYDLALEAITLFAHSIGTTPESSNFAYTFDRVEGPFVILKRRKASKCRLCLRIHQHQNPYLFITPDSLNVFFHCRRAPQNKKLYIGCLLSEEEKSEKGDIGLKSLDVVMGSVATVVEDKKMESIKNTWTEEKLKKLRAIAESPPENKQKKEIEKKVNTELVNSVMKNILRKKRSA
jgi:hypothetical protein